MGEPDGVEAADVAEGVDTVGTACKRAPFVSSVQCSDCPDAGCFVSPRSGRLNVFARGAERLLGDLVRKPPRSQAVKARPLPNDPFSGGEPGAWSDRAADGASPGRTWATPPGAGWDAAWAAGCSVACSGACMLLDTTPDSTRSPASGTGACSALPVSWAPEEGVMTTRGEEAEIPGIFRSLLLGTARPTRRPSGLLRRALGAWRRKGGRRAAAPPHPWPGCG